MSTLTGRHWPLTSLGSVVKFLSGGTPNKSTENYWNGRIPWVTSGEMTSERIHTTEYALTEEGAVAGSRLVPKGTSFIVVRGMSLAKEFRVSMAMRDMAFNQDVKAVILCDEFDRTFIYYYLKSQSNPIRDSASEAAHGTKKLDMAVLEQWPIPRVPLDTQKKIAAVLCRYDDLIENNKRRITLLENMAEEIYREWFVRFRFPGWQGAEFEKGQPASWMYQKIAEAFDFTGGGTPSKDNDSFWRNGDIDWYTPSDITKSNSLFMASSEYQCNEEGLRRSSAKLFPAYSVMMTSRATIGAIGINTKPACTNQGFITCIPNEQYPLTYLYHWLKAAKPHFEMLSGGATFPELIKSTFKKIEILSPDQGVIEKFDELVSPMFKQMESLAEQNRKLEQTKKQLLPRLISGKLSVENLDIQFPASMQSDQLDNADEAAA